MFIYIFYFSQASQQPAHRFHSAHFTDEEIQAYSDEAALTSYLWNWELNPSQSLSIFSFSEGQVKTLKTTCLVCFLLLYVTIYFWAGHQLSFLKRYPKTHQMIKAFPKSNGAFLPQGDAWPFLNADLDLPKPFLCFLLVCSPLPNTLLELSSACCLIQY